MRASVRMKQSRTSDTGIVRQAVGGLLLAAAFVASAVMAVGQLTGMAIPGCGAGSACADAAASVWGRLPVVDWPVSFLGAAYFDAVLVAWAVSRGWLARPLRWVVRLGVAVSAFYLMLVLFGGYFCPYCLAAHVAHLAFWPVMETAPRPRERVNPALPVGLAGMLFVTTTLGLAITQMAIAGDVAQRAERDLAESSQELVERSTQAPATQSRPAPPPDEPLIPRAGTPPTQPSASGVEDQAAAEEVDATTEKPADGEGEPASASAGFTGRYQLGPERALARVVVFSDYQCPGCKQIEQQLKELLANRSDISFSHKHFPFNHDCNPYAPNKHSGACRSARLAEAAGIVGGEAAFWQVHHWLFERGGLFSDEDARQALTAMALDADRILAEAGSAEVAARITADVEEARRLGIASTPVVYINGVELRGWNAPRSVARAVDALEKAGATPATAANDTPPVAAEKYVGDWRMIPRKPAPPKENIHYRGPADAPVKIVMYGDLQEPTVGEAHQLILAAIENRPFVAYDFRLLPVNSECNPAIERTAHPQACLAAYAITAAGNLGGGEAYWGMVDWLIENRTDLTDAGVIDAAVQLGLDKDAFAAALASEEVRAAVREEATASRGVGVDRVPAIFINDRWMIRWRVEGDDILGIVLDAARSER